MVQYRVKKTNIYIGNISIGSEYFTILQDPYIYTVQIKVSDTVDENHEPGGIDGCAIVGQV